MSKIFAVPVVALVLAFSCGLRAQQVPAQTAIVGGVRLQYVDWGGKGPALLLVPGGCDTAFVFGDLAPRLTGTFHVLSFTPRGCAGSDGADNAYTLDDQLRELAGFLDTQGIQHATLAGHSSGGGKVVRFARLYPERVDRLVVFDTVYSFIAAGLEERMTAAITRRLAATNTRSFERFRTIERAWELDVWSPALERNATLTFNHPAADSWWMAFRADMDAGLYFETAIRVPALMFFSIDLDSARLTQFDKSTQAELEPLVEQTEARRRDQIEAFRRNGSNVHIVEMRKASHYCFAHKPEEIARAIRAFVQR